MSSELEYLQRVRNDILTHIQAFPNDSFGHKKLAHVDAEIERISDIPLMGHMAKRPPSPAKKVIEAWKAKRSNPFKGLENFNWGEALEKAKHPLTGEAPFPSEGDVAPRYTFGADYEMDQLWLAAEREKANHPMMTGTPGGPVHLARRSISPAEPDRMMFPTMAYNLTSMHNMNYGTSRY